MIAVLRDSTKNNLPAQRKPKSSRGLSITPQLFTNMKLQPVHNCTVFTYDSQFKLTCLRNNTHKCPYLSSEAQVPTHEKLTSEQHHPSMKRFAVVPPPKLLSLSNYALSGSIKPLASLFLISLTLGAAD